MLPASIAPSAAPAPTTVCSSSMKVMTSPGQDPLEDGLEPLLELAAYLAPATMDPRSSATTRLFFVGLGDVPLDDAGRQALDDGGLADAGLADEDGVVPWCGGTGPG